MCSDESENLTKMAEHEQRTPLRFIGQVNTYQISCLSYLTVIMRKTTNFVTGNMFSLLLRSHRFVMIFSHLDLSGHESFYIIFTAICNIANFKIKHQGSILCIAHDRTSWCLVWLLIQYFRFWDLLYNFLKDFDLSVYLNLVLLMRGLFLKHVHSISKFTIWYD